MKHTPGEWINNGGIIGPEGTLSDEAVCIVGKPNEQTVQNTANARLIAASPDLLAAAQEIKRIFGNGTNKYVDESIRKALLDNSAAIAKAVGND